MPTRRPWEERLTPIDLFLEKRKIPILWRIYAVVATWLLTVGYGTQHILDSYLRRLTGHL